jgi:hypothetical protein
LRLNTKLSCKLRLAASYFTGFFNRCFFNFHILQPKITFTTLYYNLRLYISTFIFCTWTYPISAWNTPHNTATPLISTPH